MIGINYYEYESIQSRLNHQHPKKDEMASKRMFDRLVSMGNLKAAIRLVTDQDSGQSLPLDSTQPDGRSVREHLLDKHPVGTPASASGSVIPLQLPNHIRSSLTV